MKNKSLVNGRIASIGYALEGLKELMKEPNAKIHIIAAIGAIVMGFLQHISTAKWVALVFAIAMVLVAEAFNTAIEKICDLGTDGQFHPVVKIIKDVAAAAVLIAAAASTAIGVFIFFY